MIVMFSTLLDQVPQGAFSTEIDTVMATAQTTVIASVVAVLNDVHAALKAAGTDPAKLAALSTEIQTKIAALTANTVP